MILNFAHFICVDHAPMVLATRCSSADARAALQVLHAADLGLLGADLARWRGATLGGTSFRQGGPDPQGIGIYAHIYRKKGVSLDIAPLAGLGFWHEWATAGEVHLSPPAVQRQADQDAALVRDVVQRWTPPHATPLVAVTASLSEGWEPFEHAFRRRIAYALGFHASLRAGSLACYEASYEGVIRGTVAHVERLLRAPEAADDFSIALNLLARLQSTWAAETYHGAPDPRAPGAVVFYGEKVARLRARLATAARALAKGMNVDGRVALRALLVQLRLEREMRTVMEFPIWGQHIPGTLLDDHPTF